MNSWYQCHFDMKHSTKPLHIGKLWPALVALALGSTGVVPGAEVLQEGDAFGELEAKDQHGEPFKFEPGIRFVLVSFDMSTGKKANQTLAAQGKDFLPKHRAVFVSNIHGMPAIGRLFALPKMRKYPHRIILADEEGLLAHYPRQEDRVTVLQLNDRGTIVRIIYWDPEKDGLDAVLKDPAEKAAR